MPVLNRNEIALQFGQRQRHSVPGTPLTEKINSNAPPLVKIMKLNLRNGNSLPRPFDGGNVRPRSNWSSEKNLEIIISSEVFPITRTIEGDTCGGHKLRSGNWLTRATRCDSWHSWFVWTDCINCPVIFYYHYQCLTIGSLHASLLSKHKIPVHAFMHKHERDRVCATKTQIKFAFHGAAEEILYKTANTLWRTVPLDARSLSHSIFLSLFAAFADLHCHFSVRVRNNDH